MQFKDRVHAGRILAGHLTHYANRPDVIVLGLARGGVPVAFEVAQALGAPLDVAIVRKLGVPGQPELAMGAIAPGAVTFINQSMVDQLRLSRAKLDAVIARETEELARRQLAYRGTRAAPKVAGLTVILVDDGLATGATMRAAIAAFRQLGAARVIVAVPLGAGETCEALRAEADELVCAMTPEPFYSVGAWYRDFSQTSDEEVKRLLG